MYGPANAWVLVQLESEEEANLSAHEGVESDSDSEDETPLAQVGSKDEVRMATPPTTKVS